MIRKTRKWQAIYWTMFPVLRFKEAKYTIAYLTDKIYYLTTPKRVFEDGLTPNQKLLNLAQEIINFVKANN